MGRRSESVAYPGDRGVRFLRSLLVEINTVISFKYRFACEYLYTRSMGPVALFGGLLVGRWPVRGDAGHLLRHSRPDGPTTDGLQLNSPTVSG